MSNEAAHCFLLDREQLSIISFQSRWAVAEGSFVGLPRLMGTVYRGGAITVIK